MVKTELILQPSKYWIYRLAAQFGIKSTSAAYLSYTAENCHLFLNYTDLEKEFSVLTGEVHWQSSILTHKKGGADYLTILLFKSEGELTHRVSDKKDNEITETSTDALLFWGDECNIQTEWPENKIVRFVAVHFSKEWLAATLGNSNEAEMAEFFKMLAFQTGIYTSKVIPRFRGMWVNDFFPADDKAMTRLELKSKSFQFVADFIEYLYRRHTKDKTSANPKP